MGICRREFGACLLGGLTSQLLGAPARPKLLVLVLIEQFPQNYLENLRLQLSPGGFRKLLEKGAIFYNCIHGATTFPSTTLSTLATGAWPATHGIVADTWFDRASRKVVQATDDQLLATTLAAQVASDRRSRVTVIGLNEEQSTLFAGSPDARLFWMDPAGRFATAGETPDWLSLYNNQKAADAARNYKWVALGARADAPPLRTLTYSPERPDEFMTLYRSSPLGQGAQFEFLSDLIAHDRMGLGNTLDFVCLLAGSTEVLGYETGSRHPLMQQMMLHLDRRLEALLNQLSKTVGDANFDLVVAGAHGAPPEPPVDLRERMSVDGDEIARAVNQGLAGNGKVDKYLYPFLFLNPGASQDPEPVRLRAGRAALSHSAVAGFYTAGGNCSVHDGWERRYSNSFHPVRSGDVMLSYRPELVERYGPRGVSYGSLYNYDARVPLFFYGPNFRAGVYEQSVESVDVTPTLARVMGVDPPSSSVGRVLGEALIE